MQEEEAAALGTAHAVIEGLGPLAQVDYTVTAEEAAVLQANATIFKQHVVLNKKALGEQLCASVRGLCSKSSDNCAAVGKALIPPVLAYMEQHLHYAPIQLACSQAVAKLATVSDNLPLILRAKGAETLLLAISAHTGDNGISKWGCAAVLNTASNLDGRLSFRRHNLISFVQGRSGQVSTCAQAYERIFSDA